MPGHKLDRDELLLSMRAGKDWAARVYQTVSLRLGRPLAQAIAAGDEAADTYWPFFPTPKDGIAVLAPYYAEGRLREEVRRSALVLVAHRAAAAHYDVLCVTGGPSGQSGPPSSP